MSTYPGECSGDSGCPIHSGVQYAHMSPGESALYLTDTPINAALERAIPDSWDDDDSWSGIASNWIEHMATTHGAHCAGRGCLATADTPAYVAALRRAWRDTAYYARTLAFASYQDAIRDLAHELGVDLDD